MFENGTIKEQGNYVELLRNPQGALRKVILSKNNPGDLQEVSLFGRIIEGTGRAQSKEAPGKRRRTSVFNNIGFFEKLASHQESNKLDDLMEVDEDEDSSSDLSKSLSKESLELRLANNGSKKIRSALNTKAQDKDSSVFTKSTNRCASKPLIVIEDGLPKPIFSHREPDSARPKEQKEKRESSLNSSKVSMQSLKESSKNVFSSVSVINSFQQSTLKKKGATTKKESLDYEQANSYFKKYLFLRGKCPVVLIMVMFLVSSLFIVSYDLWIGFWSQKLFGEKEDKPLFYFWVYFALGVSGSLYLVFRDVLFDHFMYSSSNLINRMLLNVVMRLRMEWFDQQPVDRIMYRLTKDQSQLDILIPHMVLGLIESTMLVIVGFIILNFIYFGLIILVCLLLACVLYGIFKKYLRITLKLNHLVSIRKSEVVSIGAQTLDLCVYLRGTNNIGYLKSNFFDKNDKFQRCLTHVGNFSQRWIGIRMTYLSAMLVFLAYALPMLASLKRDFFFKDVWRIALALTWNFKTIKNIKKAVRSVSLVYAKMISVSRLYEYVETKHMVEGRLGEMPKISEKASKAIKNMKKLSKKDVSKINSVAPSQSKTATTKIDSCSSPTNSKSSEMSVAFHNKMKLMQKFKFNSISLKNLTIKLTNKNKILDNLTIRVPSNSVMGLYGRSSSGIPEMLELICGLYDRHRSPEESHIRIGGKDIEEFTQKSWRSCISFLKEEPLIIAGTVRQNIDPYNQYDDELIIKTLDYLKFNELISLEKQGNEPGGFVGSMVGIREEEEEWSLEEENVQLTEESVIHSLMQ